MSYQATLAIVNEDGRVLARRQEAQLSLPVVEVAPGRVGISLSRAARAQLGLEIFCLVAPGAASRGIHLLRLQSSSQTLPPSLAWIASSELSGEAAADSILRDAEVSAGEFGGYAWYSQVAAWLEEQISRLGYRILGLEQWNGRVGGVLLRVLTNGPNLWFKAVSDFNAREIGIAQMLASKHPAHFPRVVATQPAWSAFLLEHVEGMELYDCNDLSIWKTVASLLADIQMDWMGGEDALLRAGAADLRAEAIAARLPEFLDHIDDAMARQPKTPPSRLTRVDLDELGSALYALCADVAALPFAGGLANADFSPHNTLITNRGPVFIDWAEACVSLPLIAGEYMWNRMVMESPDRARWQSALRTAYLCRWAESYGAAELEQAAKLLPAFAVLAVALFYSEGKGQNGEYDIYLRSLTRRVALELKKSSHQSYAIQA